MTVSYSQYNFEYDSHVQLPIFKILSAEDRDRSLTRKLERMAGSLRNASGTDTAQRRRNALADTLQDIAKRLSKQNA